MKTENQQVSICLGYPSGIMPRWKEKLHSKVQVGVRGCLPSLRGCWCSTKKNEPERISCCHSHLLNLSFNSNQYLLIINSISGAAVDFMFVFPPNYCVDILIT